jgi:hypothetical protein
VTKPKRTGKTANKSSAKVIADKIVAKTTKPSPIVYNVWYNIANRWTDMGPKPGAIQDWDAVPGLTWQQARETLSSRGIELGGSFFDIRELLSKNKPGKVVNTDPGAPAPVEPHTVVGYNVWNVKYQRWTNYLQNPEEPQRKTAAAAFMTCHDLNHVWEDNYHGYLIYQVRELLSDNSPGKVVTTEALTHDPKLPSETPIQQGWRKAKPEDIKRGTLIRIGNVMSDGAYGCATIIATMISQSCSSPKLEGTVKVARPVAYADGHVDINQPMLYAEVFEISVDRILHQDSDIEVFQGRDGVRSMTT